VAAKFKIEKAKTKISRNIVISHYTVPVRVGNSGSLAVIREEALKIDGLLVNF
jgi:hypothetical protein